MNSVSLDTLPSRLKTRMTKALTLSSPAHLLQQYKMLLVQDAARAWHGFLEAAKEVCAFEMSKAVSYCRGPPGATTHQD
jgi:hypothetical protein